MNRSVLAGTWPRKFCCHILHAAEQCLEHQVEVVHCAMHAATLVAHVWETVPVGPGDVPEEHLRKHLGDLQALRFCPEENGH